jgi:hypothetical protein
MKRLVCLCALFFAGQAMAQTTCTNATAKGTYMGVNPSGELAAGVHIYDEGLATLNGDGTGTLNFNYTETGGLVNSSGTAAIAYTVNSDCSVTGTGTALGVPIPFRGHISPSGSTITFVTQMVGISLNALLTRQ